VNLNKQKLSGLEESNVAESCNVIKSTFSIIWSEVQSKPNLY